MVLAQTAGFHPQKTDSSQSLHQTELDNAFSLSADILAAAGDPKLTMRLNLLC